MPNTTVSATGQTGSTCTQSGPYRSSGRARLVIFVKSGDLFPTDWDGSNTTWVLVTSSTS